jgi:cysteine desulfuration protein SufE
VLIQGLQGEKPTLAQNIPESLAIDLFGESLSMGKSLGLTNMIRIVRAEAAKLA